jgi:hypothetical protein
LVSALYFGGHLDMQDYENVTNATNLQTLPPAKKTAFS